MTMVLRLIARSDLNANVKSICGPPYRARVHAAWAYDANVFWRHQSECFSRVYRHALDNVFYYMSAVEQYPRLPLDRDVREVIAGLPILTKSELRVNNERLWYRAWRPLVTVHSTSGTSGTPIRLAASLGERAFQQCVLEDWFARICGMRRPRTLFLSGFVVPTTSNGNIGWRGPLSGNVYLSIYSMKSERRGEYAEVMARLRPQLIYGYASALNELARIVEGKREPWQETCIAVSTSEMLLPEWRQRIESNLCRRVYDLYGSQEGSHLAVECEHGASHVHPLVGVVEIVDDSGRPVAKGEVGRVVVSGLTKRTMPLIRYELGDVAESTGFATNCACGLEWPTIGRVDGRQEDLVRTRDGRRIGYLSFHATRALRGVVESQLTQVGFECFRMRLVLDSEGQARRELIESHIAQQISARLGIAPHLSYEYVDVIPRGPRGKAKAVVVEDFVET